MTVDYLLLCDAVEESPVGTPVVIGVLDALAHPVVPMRPRAIWFFARVRGIPGTIVPIDVVWRDPRGAEVWGAKHRIEAGPRGLSYWWRAMASLTFSTPGTHRLELRSAGRVLAATDLEITQLPREPERVQ